MKVTVDVEAALYLTEASEAASIIHNIRSEITNAVRGALINRAYDTDAELSFGSIHINAKGSVSQISFGGSDVTDMDAFVAKQAFHIDDEHYFDIRSIIKDKPEDFCYYPIQIGGKVSLTVLKSSPFFEQKYGRSIHSEGLRVEYASKYLIVYRDDPTGPDIYYIGLFTPEATANTLLTKAGKTLGGKATIYYCFMNTRPELFLHLGEVQEDFKAYHPEKNRKSYNFYKGSVIGGIFKINKETDSNGKIQVKKTNRKCLRLIIAMQYGSVSNFCQQFNIEQRLLMSYLSGADTQMKYLNGDVLTPTRLVELLNLPFAPNADTLKDGNLLIKVEYDDIPA